MLNRLKSHHKRNWPNNYRATDNSVPWHPQPEPQQPVRRAGLTTLDALQLIRQRYESIRLESTQHSRPEHHDSPAPHPEQYTAPQPQANHDQQAA